MRFWTVCLIQFLTISPGLPQNVEPAIKVTVSALGISRIVNITKKIAIRELPQLEIPVVKGEQDTPLGTLSYVARDIKIDAVLSFEYLVSPVPADSLQINVLDVSVIVSGLWSYELLNIFHVHDHGTFRLLAGNLGMKIETAVGADNRGMPTFNIKQCIGSFRKLQLDVHAEQHNWIVNKFKDKILEAINKPCDILIGQVMGQIAKLLNQYDPQIPIGHKILFDARLLGAPTIETNGIHLRHKGEFFYQGDTTKPPFEPNPLPDKDTSKMISFEVSNYVFNSLSYTTHIHGLQEGDITKDNLPASYSDLLNTSCTKFLCIGFFIPQLSSTYPNSYVEIHYKDVSYPQLQLTRDGASSKMDGLYSFRTRLQDKSLAHLFSVSVTLSLNMTLAVESNTSTLHWKIKNFNMNATLVDSKIGWIPDKAGYVILEWIIRLVAIPKIDKQGRLGKRLPIPKEVNLYKSRLQFQDGYVLIESDIDNLM